MKSQMRNFEIYNIFTLTNSLEEEMLNLVRNKFGTYKIKLTGHTSYSTNKLIDMSTPEVKKESIEIMEKLLMEMTALCKIFSNSIKPIEHKAKIRTDVVSALTPFNSIPNR